jgi:hypothetical protein
MAEASACSGTAWAPGFLCVTCLGLPVHDFNYGTIGAPVVVPAWRGRVVRMGRSPGLGPVTSKYRPVPVAPKVVPGHLGGITQPGAHQRKTLSLSAQATQALA